MTTEEPIRFLIGLGNPGETYAATRHNLGARVVSRIAHRHGVGLKAHGSKARSARVSLGGAEVLLVRPRTYMNLSGEAVAPLLFGGEVGPSNLLVVCDDLALPFGAIRLRRGGGPGGHKGLASVLEFVGSEDIPRLRLGIGAPPEDDAWADYVLTPFLPDEEEKMDAFLDAAAEAATLAVVQGMEVAMNRINAKTS